MEKVRLKGKEEKVGGAALVALGNVDVLTYMDRHAIDSSFLKIIKRLTHYKDTTIAEWLGISPRTMRSYNASPTVLNKKLSEQLVLLRALFEKGQAVLGTIEAFDQWLESPNFFFDGKRPIAFLDTASGIRYIYDRLMAMEYGDNV